MSKKMLHSVIRAVTCIVTFLCALFVISRIMNKGHDNMTVEMAPASLPIVTMKQAEQLYNELHGYYRRMNVAQQRDNVTLLGAERDTEFVIDTYGNTISGISMEVRSGDGERLIEDSAVDQWEYRGDKIYGRIYLKDLIEKGTDYSLTIIVSLQDGKEAYFYSVIRWEDELHLQEKLDFARDFHDRTFDKEAAKEIARYLETNSKLEDNVSFHEVNIHSSFQQITWGDLGVKQLTEPVANLTEIAKQTASILYDYPVYIESTSGKSYYMVKEHFRVRYSVDRMYLLDYERTMTQIPDPEHMYANDKILLGITQDQVPMMESEDGNTVVFKVANRLYSYDASNNRLAVLFGFYSLGNADKRTMYDKHDIRILDVDEGGNVLFAVSGYMNRGRMEGQVGIQIYSYDNAHNTIEELIYIPSDQNASVVLKETEQLLYLNRDGELYVVLSGGMYHVNLQGRTYSREMDITQDQQLWVSENHKIVVWPGAGGIYRSNEINIKDLSTGQEKKITAGAGEAVRPLGFMDEDIIFGLARTEDVRKDHSGHVFFPMYKLCICDSSGKMLKQYQQDRIYIMGCTIDNNQITLDRVEKTEDGSYRECTSDQIMNNLEEQQGRNQIVIANIDTYKQYVQIQTKREIDSKTIKILTPKEVVYEGGRELRVENGESTKRYYVYGPYGVENMYISSAEAVTLAYDVSGTVINSAGQKIWQKSGRVSKNQIMAIHEDSSSQDRNSIAVCLDTLLKYEGIIRNTQAELDRGKSVMDILTECLPDYEILDMNGCKMDSMLYYVNQDIPVLALLESGEAVMIIGFNEFNVVIFEPDTGRIYKKGMNDSDQWFTENGNSFITYVRPKN